MTIKKIKRFLLILPTTLVLLPAVVLGYGGGGTGGTGGANPFSKYGSFEVMLLAITNQIITLGTLVLTVMIIWTGFKFVTAGGVPSNIEKAREALKWTIIGGAVLLGAKGIVTVVATTMGVVLK
jgi:hypothetical protein